MSLRRTHFYHIVIGAGQFTSFEDALACVEAYVIWLQRRCAKLGYSCICYAGISKNNRAAGSIYCGARGKKFFKVDNAYPVDPDKAPHVHIVLFANPGETIAQMTLAYFSKRNRRGQHKRCDDFLKRELPYVIGQSLKYRVACHNVDLLPQVTLAEFFKAAESINILMHGISPIFKGLSDPYFHTDPSELEDVDPDLFTNLNELSHQKHLDSTTQNSNVENAKELQNNNIYNNYNNIMQKSIVYRDSNHYNSLLIFYHHLCLSVLSNETFCPTYDTS